jgi:hypothetical protein
VDGTGAVYLLRDAGQEALLAARARLQQATVSIAERSFKAGDAEFPAGSWIVRGDGDARTALEDVARELGLIFVGAAMPDVARHEAPLPRLALWHTWADTEATGWVRYVLDREKVPYAYIRDEEVRAGALRAKYDVIVFPHTDSNLETQIHGIDRRWSPLAYTRGRRSFPATACRTRRMTSPAASDGRACSTSKRSCGKGACSSRSATAPPSRSKAAWCAACPAAATA